MGGDYKEHNNGQSIIGKLADAILKHPIARLIFMAIFLAFGIACILYAIGSWRVSDLEGVIFGASLAVISGMIAYGLGFLEDQQ